MTNPSNFTDRTEIFRQHMDRFIKPTSFNPSAATSTLLRKIDDNTEGIVPDKKIFYKEKATSIEGDPYTWYIVYMTVRAADPTQPTVNNPIRTYLCASSSLKVWPPVAPGVAYDTMKSIDEVDRTESRLVKIIQCPYCPVNFSNTTSGYFIFPDNWSVSTSGPLVGFLQYESSSNMPDFLNVYSNVVILSELSTTISSSQIGPRKPNNIEFESKLYHSDFYSDKLTYDSFYKEIKLENFVPSYSDLYNSSRLKIDFKITNTINSKLAFKIYPGAGQYLYEEDFGDTLLVSRNNEMTILNSDYINYIKTGYNYDKKANALSIEQAKRSAGISTASTVLSTLGTIAAVALAPYTGGGSLAPIALGTTTAITGLNTFNQWKNVSDTQERINNSMQAKLAQLQAQSASTSGTDDVDLMNWYSENKLWNIKYNINELDTKKIYNLLRFTGYSHHTFDKPDINSRIWYNYIQCEPDIPKGLLVGYKDEWINSLKEKYRQGVIVYHHYDNTWNLDRDYENFERWIVEGIA